VIQDKPNRLLQFYTENEYLATSIIMLHCSYHQHLHVTLNQS